MAPSRQLSLIVDGRHLEAAEWPGDERRAPLVLLHEALGSVGLWREFPSALNDATGRRVIAYSRAGHGRSAPPPGPRTRAFFDHEALEVLPEVLRQADAGEPILVGHSDGASIALVHAASHPVVGAVLIAPHVFVEVEPLAGIRDAERRYVAGDLRARLARHHDDPDVPFEAWSALWLDEGFRDWTLDAEIARLSCPVLAVQGLEDPYGSVEHVRRIAAGAAGPVELLEMTAGHSPHLEHEDGALEAIVAFVEQLALTGWRGWSPSAEGPAYAPPNRGPSRNTDCSWW